MSGHPDPFPDEDRVLRWVGSVASRFKSGIPSERFLREFKGPLAGLNFPRVEAAVKNLQKAGLVRLEWDTPGEFRVFSTPQGLQRAQVLDGLVAPPSRGPAGVARPSAMVSSPPPPVARASPAPPSFTAIPPRPSSTSAGASGTSGGLTLPQQILRYALQFSTDRRTAQPLTRELLMEHLSEVGVTLPPVQVWGVVEELQRRGILEVWPAPEGGVSIFLTPQGQAMALQFGR